MWQKPGDIYLSQGKYVVRLLEIFGMVECNSMATPMERKFMKLCGKSERPNLAIPSKYQEFIGALIFLVRA